MRRSSVEPYLRFGLAFCELGQVLVRHSGNDTELEDLAVANALALGAGHCFVVFVREGYPVNVLNQLKQSPRSARLLRHRESGGGLLAETTSVAVSSE